MFRAKRAFEDVSRQINPKKSKLEVLWIDLNVMDKFELRLEVTLMTGMSFTWRATADREWSGVISNGEDHALYRLRETTDSVSAALVSCSRDDVDWLALLKRHLRLGELQLGKESRRWAADDACYATKVAVLPGLRLLRVPVLECFVSFISSSQNSIKRLSQMLDRLSASFEGNRVGEVGGRAFYAFPSLPQLLTLDEAALRALGFGYRATYLANSLRELDSKGGVAHLEHLSRMPHVEARKALQCFCGVGPKVADCICLFSLDMDTAVPVDTHCWQLACRDYFPHWPTLVEHFGWKLDARRYLAIGDRLRGIFGTQKVGWAFMVLFAGEVHPFGQGWSGIRG